MPESIMDDLVAATAFRRLLDHLRHRTDVQNVDLMGEAGFCRNCLADWIADASAQQGRPMTGARRAKSSTACPSMNGRPAIRGRQRPNSSPG